MAINYEFERHIRAAQEAGDQTAAATLRAHLLLFKHSVVAGVVTELPKESEATTLFDYGRKPVHQDANREKETLTMREAGEYLGVSQPTLRQLMKTGRLPFIESPLDRRLKVIHRSKLDALRPNEHHP